MNSLDLIFRTVVDISWRSSCLILALLAFRALLRGRLPASVIFWAWIVVAIRLLIPVAYPTAWSPFTSAFFNDHARPTVGQQSHGTLNPSVSTEASLVAGPAAALNSTHAMPVWRKISFARWAALIWAGGIGVLLIARILAYVRFVRSLRRSHPVPARLENVVNNADLKRISMRLTDAVSAPALHGIFHPQLLVPPNFLEKLTPAELRLIVEHELAHDRRRDLLAQLLIHAALIVHWFNPLAWIAARIARDDCELACDESVLRRLNETARETYGTTLLKIVMLTHCRTTPPLGLGVVESKQQIKRRIQMIVDQPTRTLVRTLFGCAFFLIVTGFSLTRELRAQPTPDLNERNEPGLRQTLPVTTKSAGKYRLANDGLDAVFPNGTVATVGSRTISVADVRREMQMYIPSLENESSNQADFNVRFNRLQNQVISLLVERFLLIQEFNQHTDIAEKKHIPPEYVDNRIGDIVAKQFTNDREKFLAYLQSRGITMDEYRREIEEDIIFHYMKSQERQLNPPAVAKPKEGEQVHLRLIQLTRAANETDARLLDKANAILARFKNGESFEALAREFDEDKRRERGGDWGWQSKSDFKSQFAEKVFALKTGEVSEPILAPEGCFLLFVEARK